MEYLGIIMTLTIGILTMVNISSKYIPIEIIGFSFPIGMGIQTLLMFALNIFTIKHHNIIVVSIVFIVLLMLILLYTKRIKVQNLNNSIRNYLSTINLLNTNGVWLFCILISCYLLYGITAKSLFWPTFSSDSLTSFDLFAKAMAHEGKILNSLIYEKRVGFGAAYPPLYSLSLSYASIIGFSTTKIIPSLYFIFFALSLYALLYKLVNKTNASFFTLLAICTPELLAQSAINITSVTNASYASLGIISILIWHKQKESRYLFLSAILIGLNNFTRSEGIVYTLSIVLGLLLSKEALKYPRKTIYFVLISTLPFLSWNSFLLVNSDVMNKFSQVEFMPLPNFNFDQISEILKLATSTIMESSYYGLTLYIFILVIVISVWKKEIFKEQLLILSIIIFSFFGYLALLNQLKLRADSLQNIIKYSGKRFFFGHIILMWAYISTNVLVAKLFANIHQLLSLKKIK